MGTRWASASGGSNGLGFAIPINNAKRSVDDFILEGCSIDGWLGVSMGDASGPMAESLRLGGTEGALVFSVFSGSPADTAGILPGDFITSMEREFIKSSSDLLFDIGDLKPGRNVRLRLIRHGKPVELQVETGDIIVGVNGRRVASLLEFYRTLNTGPGPQVAFEINRRGSRRRLTLEKNGRER